MAARKVRSRLQTDEPIHEHAVLSGDGKYLAASCPNQTVVLIDTFKGEIVRRLGTPQAVPAEKEPRITLTPGAFSPDGQLLAFGTRVDRYFDRFNLGNDDGGRRTRRGSASGAWPRVENCGSSRTA